MTSTISISEGQEKRARKKKKHAATTLFHKHRDACGCNMDEKRRPNPRPCLFCRGHEKRHQVKRKESQIAKDTAAKKEF